MHYYQRNVGDYARDAGHLSALEHGIYNLLLDWYYSNERPIPADNAARIARVRQKYVDAILCEFFQYDEIERAYRHRRCDRDIAAYHATAEKNRKNGKRGGRPRKNPLG